MYLFKKKIPTVTKHNFCVIFNTEVQVSSEGINKL